MEWFIAVLAVAALGVAAIAAAGGMGQMGEPVLDTYRQDLPERPLTAEDLEHLRFGITLRGYAMGQVDDLLDRLQREIAQRDQRIAELADGRPLTGVGSAAAPADGVAPDDPALDQLLPPSTTAVAAEQSRPPS